MKLIAHGHIYDHYPMGADCDLDAMVDNLTAAAVSKSITSLFVDAFSAAAGLIPNLPAAAGLGGAGFTAPVSLPAPGAPNETRSE